MSKPNLLIVCPPGHYVLRNFEKLRDLANIYVGAELGDVEQHAKAADVILYTGLTGRCAPLREIWPYAKNVKWVHSLSAGVEKMLFPELVESPVPVTNARGVFKRPLAEFAVLGILYFYKRVRRLVESQRQHRWDDFLVDMMPGRVMGVVGYGEIGRECALLAHAMGMKIHALRRNPDRSSDDGTVERVFGPGELHEMLAEIDVLLAAAPLTPETRHMISAEQFKVMKPSSIIINVGRGPVIDEAALVNALQNKQVGGAALDVFEEEPLSADSPLWEMENVLISPHCTDRTENPDWLDLTAQFFIENFHRFLNGQPLENLVDKKAGY